MGIMNLTPAMRQYLEIKEKYKDCILFFRMGDFYEMFFDDAVTASKVLEITLTSRNKNKEGSIPLCGIPYHAASSYLVKLIDAGFKVAICEQVEDPKDAKGVVRRDVVRVVSPGLVVDTETLEADKNNYLAGIVVETNHAGIAFCDISTGEFRITEGTATDQFAAEIAGLDFAEIIISEQARESSFIRSFVQGAADCKVNYLDSAFFEYEDAVRCLHARFNEKTNGFNFESHGAVTRAAGAVLRYMEETQRQGLEHINLIHWYHSENYLVLGDTVRRNLELFETIQDMKKEGSLFHVMNETVTAVGGRKLRWWMKYPLVNPDTIRMRLAAVSEIKEQHLLRKDVRDQMSGVYDLERLGSKVSMGVANGRDLVALKKSIAALPCIRNIIRDGESLLIKDIYKGIDELSDVADIIERAIVDDPPPTIREGYLIRKGYNAELDELIGLSRDGKSWIASLEAKEREKTGIHNLKVGYNSVFGYYIEITKSNSHLAPETYIRKQTLVNAERYINEEL
ncbi:MAG: DNA mismatch repair protein MutS, partial [Syntrophales bacterium]|nr:DNA mismatch repair protein MutS [Syntrophales bacterium]